MRRPFFVRDKPSKRRGVCRRERIKTINEQKYLWRVMKYIFPCPEYRIPRYRWSRKRAIHKHYRMTLSSRAVNRIFQFDRESQP
jgi:hypothetical protein